MSEEEFSSETIETEEVVPDTEKKSLIRKKGKIILRKLWLKFMLNSNAMIKRWKLLKIKFEISEKNTYFADQIRFLEKLIINAKSK